ncbi:hypothetical protein BDZ89DRAFT_1136607 [Hymenopellis radicata]|nr:hypothetical protein BDZ89DRAFT_1136607 [Hymenopellis radicata]
MFSSLALPSVLLLALQLFAGQVSAHETNAHRMQRGLNPLRPKRMYDSTYHAASTPSGTPGSSCSLELEGYIAMRHVGDSSLIGYLDVTGETYTKIGDHASKYSYPAGAGVPTYIQKKGFNLFLGIYGRSILNSVVSSIASLSWDNDVFSFTSSKLFASLYASVSTGGTSVAGGLFVKSYPFIIDVVTKHISAVWIQSDVTLELTPIACKNGAEVSLQWVHGSVTADVMVALCPSGIETDIFLAFECEHGDDDGKSYY